MNREELCEIGSGKMKEANRLLGSDVSKRENGPGGPKSRFTLSGYVSCGKTAPANSAAFQRNKEKKKKLSLQSTIRYNNYTIYYENNYFFNHL